MRRTLLKDMETEIGYYRFIQYLFYQQWNQVHTYAHENGIRIVGDIPIFVSPDSADVWANKQLFQLDSKGYPLAVAGVPPDYFSDSYRTALGFLYDWAAHKAGTIMVD